MLTAAKDKASDLHDWFASERFKGIIRLYSLRQVIEQRGAIETDYPIARQAAEDFYAHLRQLFSRRKSITTFGPYSPGHAVVIKRMGIEGIYLGGWATSAKGSVTEDPGADLASYPLGQVPDEWLKLWSDEYRMSSVFRAQLRPVSVGSEFLELNILNGLGGQAANVVFADLQDRHGNKVLSIRDQNTFDVSLRRIRLMTLAHLFLIHRYKAESVHYLSPTDDNRHQTERMKDLGIFSSVNMEAGLIIVATLDRHRIAELLNPDRVALCKLIAKRPI